MSALPPKADIDRWPSRCMFRTANGHQQKNASERLQRHLARWLVAARNLGWKISKNACDAGINDLSASRRIPIRRVIAGRRGFTVIEDSFDGGTAEAGTMAIPSPRDTKSNSEPNWLIIILWLNITPRSLAATSSVRRNPESPGFEGDER